MITDPFWRKFDTFSLSSTTPPPVDELGRIVLPKELRNSLKINTKDLLEIHIEGDMIVLNRLSLRTVFVSLLVTVLGSVLLSRGMTYFHEVGVLAENPMSLLDSVTAVLSAVATWWLVKSYRAQWWLWIVADALSVTLCAMQGMWPMALLYVVYVASAVYGLSYWKKHGVYLE